VDIGATNGPKHRTDHLENHASAAEAAGKKCVMLPMGEQHENGRFNRSNGHDLGQGSFDDLYRTEAPALVRFFRRKLRSQSEAEELAQETLVRFLRVAPTTDVASPQAYLRTIANNLLRHRAKRGSTLIAEKSVELIEALDLPAREDPHRELVGREELEHFSLILNQLKPRTLEIFLLSRIDGYTYKEIARKLRMTVWGVKWHMVRAIEHVDRHRRAR